MVSLFLPIANIDKGEEGLGASKSTAESVKFRDRPQYPARDEPFREALDIKDNLNDYRPLLGVRVGV